MNFSAVHFWFLGVYHPDFLSQNMQCTLCLPRTYFGDSCVHCTVYSADAVDLCVLYMCRQARRNAGNINLYCLALGHDLGIGAYSRVRFGKLIAKDLQQSLWPQVRITPWDDAALACQVCGVYTPLDHVAISHVCHAEESRSCHFAWMTHKL